MKKHRIFGVGARRRLSTMYGIEQTFELPLHSDMAPSADDGVPFVVSYESHPITQIFNDLAVTVCNDLDRLDSEPEKGHHFYVDDEGLHILINEVEQGVISYLDLRSYCRCAKCEDEFTGERLLDKASIPESITAESVGTVGNYALAIDWSDGHHSMYPFTQLDRVLTH